MKNPFLIFLLVATFLPGCSPGPAEVSIANHSGTTISNLFVSGPHFSASIGTLGPGMTAGLVVQPEGDSRAWLSYQGGGQKIDSGGKTYFELSRRHPVAVAIGPDLKFNTPAGIKHH